MNVTAWNNGRHHPNGNGYGIKIDADDRDAYFQRRWRTIYLELEGESEPVEINLVKPSFWNDTSRELISIQIGRWLIKNGLAPWEPGNPPTLNLEQLEEFHFKLTRSLPA